MASKSKQIRQSQGKKDRNLLIWIIAIPVAAFFTKMIVASNIVAFGDFAGATQNGGWLGADGENYLNALGGLMTDGFSSQEHLLTYWPAGYPLLLWFLTKISAANLLWLISITQSAFYAYSSYYFVKQLLSTKIKKYAFVIAIVLAFNPTLSLSTLVVGYEGPLAACMLMVSALVLKSQMNAIDKRFWIRVFGVGGFFALASFMQPRWVLTAVFVGVIWAAFNQSRKIQVLILVLVLGVMSIAPAVLIARNSSAGKGPVISTNIVAALQYGTGTETAGGYQHTGPNIQCNSAKDPSNPTTGEMTKCAARWYLTNPIKTLELSWNKSIYFWSPWSGPLVNGTMARNPWIKINPLTDMSKNSQQGHDLVYGNFGKLVSWLWLFGGILLMVLGFRYLRKLGDTEKLIANLLFVPIVASWLAAIVTLGDHRFRIPTMSLSLVLQVLGLYSVARKLSK